MTKKPDKKKIDTLEKGLRNLSEHENLAPRLLKIENDIHFLKIHHWLNYVLLMITIGLFLLMGAMLL